MTTPLNHQLIALLEQIQPGEPIPPLKHLAARWKVAYATLWKAANSLREAGRLEAHRGGRWKKAKANDGSSLLGNADEKPIPPEIIGGGRGQKALQALLADLTSNRLERYPLPSSGELCRRYGISSATLRRIRADLAKQGWLKVRGKNWFWAHAKPIKRSWVAFVGLDDGHGQLWIQNNRMREFLESLEESCAAAGVGLRRIGFDPQNPSVFSRCLHKEPSLLGVLAWLDEWSGFGEKRDRRLQLLDLLVRENNPVAILDVMGDIGWKLPRLHKAPFSRYLLTSKTAGLRVGQRLLASGHEQALFLSFHHKHEWSKARFAGLGKAFAASGRTGSVLLEAQDVAYAEGDLLAACLPKKRAQYLAASGVLTHRDADLVWEHRRAMAKTWQPSLALKKRVDKTLQAWHGAKNLGVDPILVEGWRREMISHLNEAALDVYLEPLFMRALQHSKVRAWICANDATALSAIRFLKRKHKTNWNFNQLEIIGFDNTTAACDAGLSSYDFRISELARDMLGRILHGPRQNSISSQAIEYLGVLVERSLSMEVIL